MKRNINKFMKWVNLKIIMFAVLIIYTMAIIVSYRGKILQIKNKYVDTYIENLMNETNYKIELMINEKFTLIETIGNCIEEVDYNTEEAKILLNILEAGDECAFAFVGYPDGRTILNKNIGPGYIEEEYFLKAMEGERRISNVYSKGDKEYLIFAVPLHKDNKVEATLQCGYELSVFDNFIEGTSFMEKGQIFISQNDGLLITRPESIGDTDNLFKLLDNITPSNEKTLNKLENKLEKGGSGIVSYSQGKYKRYICYSSIPETDWYVLSIVSENAIDPQANKIIKANTLLSIEIIAGFAIYIICVLSFDEYQKRRAKV